MTTLVKLLLSDKLAVDENGFLYRMMAGDVAKPLRPQIPRFSNPHNKRMYFKVKLDGKYFTFCQDDLKRNQEKAIARVCK